MFNGRSLFRKTAFRFCLVAFLGFTLFTLASAGTSASAASFMQSVSQFWGVAPSSAAGEVLAVPAPTPPGDPSVETGGGALQLRGGNITGAPDTFVQFPVELISTGDITVVTFSLQFDQTRLSISGVSGTNTNPDVTVGPGAFP